MEAQNLLDELRGRGVAVWVEGDQVVVSPASALTGYDADRLRAAKPEIVAAITTHIVQVRGRDYCVTCGDPLPPTSWARCPACVASAYRERDERRAAAVDTGDHDPGR